jgi:diacylglycerol O-acyltransferase
MSSTPDAPVWGKRLGGFDASVWRASVGNPMLRSPMSGVVVLRGTPDVDVLRKRFERISRTFPVLRQRVVSPVLPLGNPRLVVDPSFDISLHVRHYRIASPGTWEQVLDHARTECLQDFDRDRPLWRAVLLEGLPEGRSALLIVVHHALADGLGLVMIASGLIDVGEEQDTVELPLVPRPGITDPWLATVASVADEVRRAVSAGRGAAQWGGDLLEDPATASRAGLRLLTSAAAVARPFLRPRSQLMARRGRSFSCRTMDVPLAALKTAGRTHDGTLNDAFVAAVLGGVRRYHARHQAPLGTLRVNLPISLRQEQHTPDSNAVAAMRVELDAAQPDVQRRMEQVHLAVRRARDEPILAHLDLLGDAGRAVPASLLTPLVTGSDITISNVPGVPMQVSVLGATAERCYPLVGTLGAAANLTLMSYAGTLASIGVTIDDAAIGDPDVFMECLREGFEEVGAALSMSQDPLAEPPLWLVS